VITWRLNFTCRRFGTLCQFHLHKWRRQEEFLLTPSYYEDGTDSVLKRWHIKFRRRRMTQKKDYNVQNMAKFRNQEKYYYVCVFAASAKCEVLQDQDDKDIRRLLLAEFLTTRRCSGPRSLLCESYFIFYILMSVYQCNRRPKESKEPNDLRTSSCLTFRITSSPFSASTFCKMPYVKSLMSFYLQVFEGVSWKYAIRR
jgi:hypothetical protein